MDDDTTNEDQFQADAADDTNPMADMSQDQQLPQDGATPFTPGAGEEDEIDDAHPTTDTGVDAQEQYDAGTEAASGGDTTVDGGPDVPPVAS